MVKKKKRSMTIVRCPYIGEDGKECGKRGYLKEETLRYHRIKHYVKPPCIDEYGKPHSEIYHRVSSEWAIKQLDDKERRDEEELRRFMV